MKQITGDIKKSIGPELSFVVFTGSNCPGCNQQKAELEKFHTTYEVDVNENSELCAEYGVRNIPTTIALKNREAIRTFRGMHKGEIITREMNKLGG